MSENNNNVQNVENVPQGTNIDDLIQNRLKFGKFQLKTLSVVGLIEFVDGAESMFIVLLISILKKQWELEKFQIESLASIFYWGLFFGAIVSGFAADILGRKKTLIFGSLLETILVVYTAFIYSYSVMFIVRFFYGFVIGVTLPIGILLMTQQSPPKVRGATTVVLQFFYTLGQLYMILLAAIYLLSLSEGNWRMMALLMTIPCLAMLLGTIFMLDQSCRFLLINRDFKQAVEVLNKMGRDNLGEDFVPLNDTEKKDLKEWRDDVFLQSYSKMDRVKLLFENENLGVTIRIWLIMIMSMFIYSGIAILMPFIFDNDEDGGVFDFFLACIGEIPALVIMFFLIDLKSVGRKKMLIIAFSLLLICFTVLWWGKEKTLVIGFMVVLFIGKMATLIFIPVMAEAYSSVERSIGIGMAASIGRIAGALAPFIFYSLYLYDKWAPFLLSAICSLVLLICVITFPFDKTGESMQPGQRPSKRQSNQIQKELDENKNQEEANLLLEEENDQPVIQNKNIEEDQNLGSINNNASGNQKSDLERNDVIGEGGSQIKTD